MAVSKTDTKVIIDGKVYTLSGYESEEYIQKIASYLNGKIEELKKEEGYSHLSRDLQTLLLEINLSDDYFKAQKKLEALNEDLESREKDLYDIKHELVTTQMRLESTEKSLKKAEQENQENAKKIIRLEASSKK
ncbi:MAG: cell division protein ZapA [Lachnospiraceae bacterium]|jgi:cell division protein ZapA|nr:cell division protein ZapA [Lachnospiraceae bacterium]MCH4027536.1 cell division protein ZapA [Lachnospiraceae bacterium]MCH4065376.1 cell division protein ZapA [Lachnospiraceae bacterium]MCH4111416.1 cell division protein ZapA [Lachnospiraceae bacterium]MCI1353012.1 cell division protein ZapA [Lachnospiraceae bacterium]